MSTKASRTGATTQKRRRAAPPPRSSDRIRPAPPAQGPSAPSRFGPADESITVRSPWVWRAFALMALVALGLFVTFALDGHIGFAAAWGVIFLAWGGFAGLLYRRHISIT